MKRMQQRLLHALARDVARDRGVVALAGDLVDLVDEDDAPLGLLDVVVGHLQQPREDALDILAHVARLGEHRGVDDREGHLQQAGDRPRHERLARTGGAHQHDVRLVDLDVVLLRGVEQPLVVVVDRHRQVTLGRILSDDVLVEELLDLRRLEQLLLLQGRHRRTGRRAGRHAVVGKDAVAVLDALVADVGSVHALEHDLHLRAGGPAERTAVVVRVAAATAGGRVLRMIRVVVFLCHYFFSLLVSTSSMSPYSRASAAESQ